jgi:hypothetical protein
LLGGARPVRSVPLFFNISKIFLTDRPFLQRQEGSEEYVHRKHKSGKKKRKKDRKDHKVRKNSRHASAERADSRQNRDNQSERSKRRRSERAQDVGAEISSPRKRAREEPVDASSAEAVSKPFSGTSILDSLKADRVEGCTSGAPSQTTLDFDNYLVFTSAKRTTVLKPSFGSFVQVKANALFCVHL